MAGGTSDARKFDHPVFKEISLTNGKINRMKKEELKECLQESGLDTRYVRLCTSQRFSCIELAARVESFDNRFEFTSCDTARTCLQFGPAALWASRVFS